MLDHQGWHPRLHQHVTNSEILPSPQEDAKLSNRNTPHDYPHQVTHHRLGEQNEHHQSNTKMRPLVTLGAAPNYAPSPKKHSCRAYTSTTLSPANPLRRRKRPNDVSHPKSSTRSSTPKQAP